MNLITTNDPQIAAMLAEEEHHAAEERALGFWTYMMSDAVIFALLFATYGVMLTRIAGGPAPHEVFELPKTFAETAMLLFSSITFGFASLAGLAKDKRKALIWLAVTLVFGLGFVGLELLEFSTMIADGAGPDRSGFLSAFFALVGTHGLHVSSGMVWIVVMMIQIQTKGLNEAVQSRMHRLGLFWHFLDIVWIGIFSFVYLPGVM